MNHRTSNLHPTTTATYRQLATWIARRHQAGDRIIGINGAQGSGKSTLAKFLVEELAANHGLDAVAVSIDDFYLSKAARQQLADAVHPLLITRGVPGTHDVALGKQCLQALRDGQACTLPVFDKASDDQLPESEWRHIDAGTALVLFEGWCVGTPPQPPEALNEPVNALERESDPDGAWRRYVNEQLASYYAGWFAMLDALVFLRVPGWAQVQTWRTQQEQETAAASGNQTTLNSSAALAHFMAHYERLTRHAFAELPERANRVIDIDYQHIAHWLQGQ